MKTLLLIIFLNLLSLQMDVKAESLNEAVNQVKSEGRVLSAKTINNKHEVKVLTPSGTVKTYNIDATPKLIEAREPKYYSPVGQAMRESKRKSDIPERFNNRQKGMKQDGRKLNLPPEPRKVTPVIKKKDK